MYCVKCGKQIDDNVKYCVYCGADVGNPVNTRNTNRNIYQNIQSVKTHLTEAILVTIFCCLIGGIVSIVYAANTSSAISAGDYDRAVENSEKAKTWVNVSFWVGIVVNVIGVLTRFSNFR